MPNSKISEIKLPSGIVYDVADKRVPDKEDTANKVTSVSSSSTDAQYPSAKCLYDIMQRMGTNVYYVEGPSTDTTAGTWTGTIAGIAAYYDGLTVIYVPAVAGASTTTLNINGLGKKTCYLTGTSTKLTTHFGVGTPIMLTYRQNKWLRADYDTNSNTIPSGYCVTSASTAEKVASCTYYFISGPHYLHIVIRYSNTKASGLTLNVNSEGAYPIHINGQPSSATNYTLPRGTYIVFFDGTAYQFRTDGVIPGTITDVLIDGTSVVTNGVASISTPTGYVAKTGDTMTGDLTIDKANSAVVLRGTDTTKDEYEIQNATDGSFRIAARQNRDTSALWNDVLLIDRKKLNFAGSFIHGNENDNGRYALNTLAMLRPDMNANRLFGLPAECIIVEVSYDAGVTWQDAGVDNDTKRRLLSYDYDVQIPFPKKNGSASTDVWLRITFTNNVYNVPTGTSETGKYAYWNNTYYSSRIFQGPINGFYIYFYAVAGDIKVYGSNMYTPDDWTELASEDWSGTTADLRQYLLPTVQKYMYGGNSASYVNNIRIVLKRSYVSSSITDAIRTVQLLSNFAWSSNNMIEHGVPYKVRLDGALEMKTPIVLSDGTTTTPKMVFQRGTENDGYVDYGIYASSDACLRIASKEGSTWTDRYMFSRTKFTAPAIAVEGGTSSQFMKADGTLDPNAYVKKPSGEGTSGQVLATNGDGTTRWTNQQSGSPSRYAHDSSVNEDSPTNVSLVLGSTCDSQCAFDVGNLSQNVDMHISVSANSYKGCHTFIFVNNGQNTVTITPMNGTQNVLMVNPATSFNVPVFNHVQGIDYVVVKVYYDIIDFPENGSYSTKGVIRIEVVNNSDIQ